MADAEIASGEYIGDLNQMVLRSDTTISSAPNMSDSVVAPPTEQSFDMLPELNSGTNNEHGGSNRPLPTPAASSSTDNGTERPKRQLEAALALAAVEAAEFIAEATASEVALPVVHSAADGLAATTAPEAAAATGLIAAGELEAAAVPIAAASLLVPPIKVSPSDTVDAQQPNSAAGDQQAGYSDGNDMSGGDPPKKPKLPTEPKAVGPGFVKFGDNTIITTDVSETPIYELKPSESTVPNFIAQGIPLVVNSPLNFVAADHRISLQSSIVPIDTQGSVTAAVAQTALVFDYHERPLAAEHRTLAEVRFGAPQATAYLAPTELRPYMIGNSVSAKYVTDALRPYLMPANLQLLPNLADDFMNRQIFYDNRAMYAKLVCQALARDIASGAGNQVTAAAWPAAASVTFINLDDAATTAVTISNSIASDNIIFVQNRDWFTEDLMLTHWLATPGFRVDGAEDHATSYAGYINWPEIKVTVMHHGAAPARPAAALVTSQAILRFAQRIAEQRNELDAFTKGIYIALELVGIRYCFDAAHAYPIHSNFNAGVVYLPKPADYNFMLRATNLKPKMDPALVPEGTHFAATTTTERWRLAALYNGLISAFSTTLLHSISICVQDILDWGTNAAEQNPSSMLLNYGFCHPPKGSTSESVMFSVTKLAIKHYIGLVAPTGLFTASTWNGEVGSNANIAHSFLNQNAGSTPRFDNLLAIDNFLLSRPQEWGILGPHTKVDLQKELTVQSSRNTSRGIRTYRGDSQYTERARSNTPYLFVPYGNQIVNAIHQALELGAAAVSYNATTWNAGGVAEWEAPANYPDAAYIAGLHVFQPCALATYKHSDKEVRAPAMVNAALTLNQRTQLTTWRGQELDKVGFALHSNPNDRFVPLEPPPMEAFSALSMFGPTSPDKAAHSEESQKEALN